MIPKAGKQKAGVMNQMTLERKNEEKELKSSIRHDHVKSPHHCSIDDRQGTHPKFGGGRQKKQMKNLCASGWHGSSNTIFFKSERTWLKTETMYTFCSVGGAGTRSFIEPCKEES